MKQIYMTSLFFTILIVTKALNLRNSNQMESRIESNYSNLSVAPDQSNNENQEREQSQIKKLKGIIQDLVINILKKLFNNYIKSIKIVKLEDTLKINENQPSFKYSKKTLFCIYLFISLLFTSIFTEY